MKLSDEIYGIASGVESVDYGYLYKRVTELEQQLKSCTLIKDTLMDGHKKETRARENLHEKLEELETQINKLEELLKQHDAKIYMQNNQYVYTHLDTFNYWCAPSLTELISRIESTGIAL